MMKGKRMEGKKSKDRNKRRQRGKIKNKIARAKARDGSKQDN